jgi:hypothetical protein
MRDDERATIRVLGGIAGVTAAGTGVYVLAISHVGHLASTALALLAVSLLLFIAAAEPDSGDAPTAEELE